ncbi:MAG: hypothetical protein FWC36_05540 [Spirochaetes bacterium]|nr:hypothetical protein [Spirochaetota bacterium]
MIEKKELFNIADFILNKADEKDLGVIEEVLKRRLEQKSKSPGGVDINYLARTAGDSISKQLSYSREQVRETVTGFVKGIIKQHAPEIGDNELKVLLDEWVPDPEAAKKKHAEKEKKLPNDVIIKMIDQFLRFSNDQMSLDEQKALRDSMPQWQEDYWKAFPLRIRGLLTLYLKGKIDSEACWREIKKELFDEQESANQQKNNL